LELVRLTVQDLDLQQGLVRLFGKGDKERLVPIGKEASHWLNRYMTEARPQLLKDKKTTALWLSSHGGGPLSYVAIYRQLRTLTRQGGLPRSMLTPHNLRRACTTHLLEHGASPLLLQELLGHERLATLSQYVSQTIAQIKTTHQHTAPGE
jgi:integrase/recombinase XerD